MLRNYKRGGYSRKKYRYSLGGNFPFQADGTYDPADVQAYEVALAQQKAGNPPFVDGFSRSGPGPTQDSLLFPQYAAPRPTGRNYTTTSSTFNPNPRPAAPLDISLSNTSLPRSSELLQFGLPSQRKTDADLRFDWPPYNNNPGGTGTRVDRATASGRPSVASQPDAGGEIPWTKGMKAGSVIGGAALAASAIDAFRKPEVENPHLIDTSVPNLRFDERPLTERIQQQNTAARNTINNATTSAAVRRANLLGITAGTSRQMSELGVKGQEIRNQLAAQKYGMQYQKDAANSQIKTYTDDINARNRAAARLSRDTFFANAMDYGQTVSNLGTSMAENRLKFKFADELSPQYGFNYDAVGQTIKGKRISPEDAVLFEQWKEETKNSNKKGGRRPK